MKSILNRWLRRVGFLKRCPLSDQVDGYLEFLDVNWEYSFATVHEGYYGNLGTYEGKTFKEADYEDVPKEYRNIPRYNF